MTLLDIVIDNKTYSLKDTLKIKEYRQVNGVLSALADMAPVLKENDTAKLTEIMGQIQKITIENWQFMEGVVKRCWGISDAEYEEENNDRMLLLFSEVVQMSRMPKKKLLTPSSSESITGQIQLS